jgi:hypothetical protein
MAKRLRCRIGRHHWVRMSAGGETFGGCNYCKERDWDRFQGRKGPGTGKIIALPHSGGSA